MKNLLRACVVCLLTLSAPLLAGVQWPSLETQLAEAHAAPGSALEALIKANQDVSILDPSEADDTLSIPVWLRVVWRKAHPGAPASADPTKGYPRVLHEVFEWMMTHQDLRSGPGVGGEAEPGAEQSPLSVSVGGNLRMSGAQTTPRSESDVRINFWDPTKIISASNAITSSGHQAQFWSTNSGVSWGQTSLPLAGGTTDAFHSDPAVDWSSDGTAWSMTSR